jgi:hypothetical protein
VWAAICDEGGASGGHAGSLITLTNLARIGNQVGHSAFTRLHWLVRSCLLFNLHVP